MKSSMNFRCYFKSRPGADHDPSMDNFGYEECNLPAAPKDKEITIETMALSLDPALRCRMNDDTGVQYMKAWQIGETVLGLGGVGMVTKSNHQDYKEGDVVQAAMNWPWETQFTARTDDEMFPVSKVDEASLSCGPNSVLSVFGMTGCTSYLGVHEKGHVTPGANQTFVVSGAAGACGHLAGQIAKLLGAKKVVGICGSDSKCSYLTSKLGFDDTINYKTQNVSVRLKETCPDGINGYFDNVGGSLSEEVIKQMTPNSHVVLCGQIAVYNKDVPYPPPIAAEIQTVIKDRNITRERFLVLNFLNKFGDALKQLQEWYSSEKLKVAEFIHSGLESAPQAFVNMMISVNQMHVGKQIVQVKL